MNTIIWEHCNRCSGKKKHEILYHKEMKWSEELYENFTIHDSNIYELMKCCGCDSVLLRHKNCFSEDYDPATGEPLVTVNFYPPQTFRKKPEWLYYTLESDSKIISHSHTLGEPIKELIGEIYIALHNDSLRLAVMGIRALLETVMIDKVGDKGSFAANINAFQNEGFVSAKQREVLEPVLEAGHATIHRGYNPEKFEVTRLMDITESIIETIYINTEKIKSIAEKIPPHKKQKKS